MTKLVIVDRRRKGPGVGRKMISLVLAYLAGNLKDNPGTWESWVLMGGVVRPG